MRSAVLFIGTFFFLMVATAAEVQLDGHRVVYESRGNARPVLVLIHGWTCDRSLWAPQMSSLSKEFRIIALDLPGHGESDKPEGIVYGTKLFARAVVKVMDDAGVQRAVLVGHSMGLPVIREVLAQAPDRVAALVSVDGALLRISTASMARRFAGETGMENRRKFAESFFVPATPENVRLSATRAMLATPEHVAVSAMEHGVSYTWDAAGPVTTVPVLAVNQKRNSDTVAKLFRDAFPNLEYHELEGAGHFLHLEQPEQFNATLTDFVRRKLAPEQSRP